MLKKFESNDLFVNRIKTYPKVRVFTYSGSMYYNNGAVPDDGVKLFDFLMEPQTPQGPIVPVTTIATEDGQFLLTENSEFILIE